MPLIKCDTCGYRNKLSVEAQVCTNCGSPLSSEQLAVQFFEPGLLVTQEEDYPEARSIQPSKHSASTQPLLPLPATQSPQPPMILKEITALEPRQELSPYSVADQSLAPYESSSRDMFTIVREERGLQSPTSSQAPWQADKLPTGFPHRPPELWGKVVLVQSQLENPPLAGLGFFLRLLRDVLWPVPNEVRAKEQEKIMITTIRVRGENGQPQDARIHGYLRGANVSLGDTISIWGKRRRRGAIYIRKAYNHTVQGAVSTSAMIESGQFFLLLIIVTIVGLLTLSWLQVPIPFLPHLSLPSLPGQ
ncbi:hypothetical protein [Ktedonobacter racemifer]|uniref:Uncharacterized protein n=1 Tax=Ktedonobacter racemifer DSM 44963 TaxID=485913 RepID=D6TV94_KTERA|nr:hypothetical protein [Ktedonobacter racemifer]EFH84194.1 hypothetical protein Krac_5216 [Ktedonobacter racemifer DSM 44963]